jgi:hypothetical protein
MIRSFGIANMRCMISFIRPCRWAASSAMARSAAEVNRTFQPRCVASRPKAIARWVLPVPLYTAEAL